MMSPSHFMTSHSASAPGTPPAGGFAPAQKVATNVEKNATKIRKAINVKIFNFFVFKMISLRHDISITSKIAMTQAQLNIFVYKLHLE